MDIEVENFLNAATRIRNRDALALLPKSSVSTCFTIAAFFIEINICIYISMEAFYISLG